MNYPLPDGRTPRPSSGRKYSGGARRAGGSAPLRPHREHCPIRGAHPEHQGLTHV
ncbi:hypothetical protein SAMN05421539_101374 [Jannaschia seohaensis]|uniref:Uncharacterized protein n=1 Tax=Jannaschia seohaensis TaxID=475081 RepID=A0A2Y9C3Q8_9RHOB|nr:hypothetical protein BCF38_101374 [Jannaschia seohaensis]SSA38243.1 hypothetical protein SAMN05421539_101374 [Jannaschia seohaensis]